MLRILLAVALALTGAPLMAEGFRTVDSRDTFLGLVSGKSLTRAGVSLDVTRGGRISGRAFGLDVRGAWRWDGRYFCRDVTFGRQRMGATCEAVQVRGQTLRFIAKRGTGQFADLRLE